MFNYIGRVIDQISQRHFSNETIATVIGVFLGLGIAAVIITSSLATGGVTGLGVIGAVGFSHVLAGSGSILGKIAFGFFWTSITTGFCKRIGTLFDQIFMPGQTIIDFIATERVELIHDFPLVLQAENKTQVQKDIKFEEQNSMQKITDKLRQFKPSTASYQHIDQDQPAANRTIDTEKTTTCSSYFYKLFKPTSKHVDEIEMQQSSISNLQFG